MILLLVLEYNSKKLYTIQWIFKLIYLIHVSQYENSNKKNILDLLNITHHWVLLILN